ncbi:hypothetical protein BDW_05720 [Bdellovibrio bacteriovorus W]|nr:hypothetical protein BDW_05720 [Bdellovibrio bacteriovorus W]
MIKSIFVFLFAVSAQANIGVDSSKLVPVWDGKLAICSAATDIGKAGMFLRNLGIEKDENSQWLSVTPLYVTCVADGSEKAKWVEVSFEDISSSRIADSFGKEFHVVIESRELVAQVNEADAFVGQPSLRGDKNVAIDVRVFELLKQRHADDLAESGKIFVPVDLAIRNTIAVYDEDSKLVDRYYNFTGWHRVQLSVSQ